MKKVVIHAGFPKTGSSSIQNYLHTNKLMLKEHSIDYFDSDHIENGYNLGVSLTKDHPYWVDGKSHYYLEQFRCNILNSSCDVGVISYDGFCVVPKHGLRAIHAIISEFSCEVTFVIYLRRQDQWLQSKYIQNLKHGKTVESPRDFVFSRCEDSLDYYMVVSEISAIFGSESIRVRSYDECQSKGIDVVEDFLGIFFHERTLIKKSIVNPGLSPEFLKVLLSYSKLQSENERSEKAFKLYNLLTLIDTKSSYIYPLISNDDAEEILDIYDESNNKLAKSYFFGVNPFNRIDSYEYIDIEKPIYGDDIVNIVESYVDNADAYNNISCQLHNLKIESSNNKRFLNIVRSINNKSIEAILIYGCNAYGEFVYSSINTCLDYNYIAFLDKKPQEYFCGEKVFSPLVFDMKDIDSERTIIILATDIYYESMRSDLKDSSLDKCLIVEF